MSYLKAPSSGPKSKMFGKYFQYSLIAIVIFAVIAVLAFTVFKDDKPDYSNSKFMQYEAPSDDTTVVVFETTKGTIKAVIYEKEAPNYCEMFKKLVNDGYFNDTYVCSILKTQEGQHGGFIGGSKTTDGLANEDTNTDMVKLEVSNNLLPTKGALGSLVKSGGIFSKAKAGSVYTFFNDVVDVDELNKTMESQEPSDGIKRVSELFATYGGIPNYVQQYTIFGQVYDGWDALEAINSTEIIGEGLADDEEGKSYSPKEEIKFTNVYLSTYGEQKENGYNIPKKSDSVDINNSNSVESDNSVDENSDTSKADDSSVEE